MGNLSRLSLKVKLIVAFLLIGLLPATIATLIAWKNGKDLIEDEVSQKVQAIRNLQEVQLHQEIDSIRAKVATEARNDTTLLAAMDFANAVRKLPEQLEASVGESKARETARGYLDTTWARNWEKIHGSAPDMLSSLKSYYDDAIAAFLAYGYVGRPEEESKGNQGLEGSDYAKAYAVYHPYYAAVVKAMQYDDLMIYDIAAGRVSYSVKKEVDLGLPLFTGAMMDTPLASAVKAALASPGKTVMTDFMRYFPSMDAPASYVATTIARAGRPVGVLIFQLSFASVDKIVNLEQKWQDRGLGASGEAFIIGQDRTLRSSLRSLIVNKDGFLSSAKARGVPASELTYISNLGTTATAMKLDSEIVTAAVQGKDEVIKGFDYDGVEVLAAIEPIFDNNNKDLGIQWFLVVKYDTEEALAGIRTLQYLLFGLIAVTAIAVLFIAWGIGSSLSNNIARIAARIGTGSQAVADASYEIASGATELAEAVTEQASSLQETSSAVVEISAMVNKSADNANETQTLARGSLEKVQDGKKAIGEMLEAMSQIRDSNEKIVAQVSHNAKEFDSVVKIISEIGSRTKVINDIVFQTKLLSFNASVEAARAGEHGKGFAVVAEEVGNLAQMSGNAAKEISSMLEESIKHVNGIASTSKTSIEKLIETGKHNVETGNDKAQRCNTVFDDIMRDAGSVTNIVEEIASGSREQATGIQEVTKAMSMLDQVTQQNSSVAQQASAAAERLSNESQTLNVLVIELETLVKGSVTPQDAVQDSRQPTQTRSRPSAAEQKTEPAAHKAGPVAQKTPKTNVVALKKNAPRQASEASSKTPGRQVANGGVVPDSNDPRFEEV